MAEETSAVKQSLPRKPVSENCLFHGRKWKSICQFMINNLYKENHLSGMRKVKFAKDICFCDGQFDFNGHFKDRTEANNYVKGTRAAISKWKKVPPAMKHLLEQFEKFEKEEVISEGFLKFVYHFIDVHGPEFISSLEKISSNLKS